MRKTLQTIALAALCLNFTTKAIAQTPENKAVDVTTKGIQIGQKVPDVPSLAKYKGKLIILDFWATWCSPCIAMIPKMEALQEQFKDQIQIIPVTYQSEQEVTSFLAKLNKGKPSSLPHITDDKKLHQLFPHIYLPHYVWIGTGGIVKGITGYQEITDTNIEQVLTSAQNQSLLKQKHDMSIPYDKTRPLFIDGNGGDGSYMMNHSAFSRYIEGLPGSISRGLSNNKTQYKITVLNVSLFLMITSSYSSLSDYYGKSRIIIEVKDPDKIASKLRSDDYDNWLKANGYCYELIVPASDHKNALHYMQEDIKRAFPEYEIIRAKRTIPAIVLVRTSALDKIQSKGGAPLNRVDSRSCQLNNMPINRLLFKMNALFFQKSPRPVIDATNYTHNIDINFDANMSSLEAINQGIAKYDLQFVEKEFPVPVIIVKDKEARL